MPEIISDHRLLIKGSEPDDLVSQFAKDVREGLSSEPKWLHCRYFYDERGSQLFEEICELPEYYLTRTEQKILQKCAAEMVGCPKKEISLVELGSGSSRKTAFLLEALLERQGHVNYFPIDISKSMLVESSKRILNEYPNLRITGLVSEYEEGIRQIGNEVDGQKLVIFLGSNIGNFGPKEAVEFLNRIRSCLDADDRLLIGTDMEKDPAIIEPAYDDAQGVTAQFNLNILKRINDELGGSFDLEHFSHRSFYNSDESRIEMYICSNRDQAVTIAALNNTFRFVEGEMFHTENSYKFSAGLIDDLCRQSGFAVANCWQDDRRYFALNLLRPV